MKYRLLALILALSALLSGCASMLERSYSSSVRHVEYTVTEDFSILRAETYRGLVDAILYFINEHTAQGVIRLYNYTTDVADDLATACHEVTTEDPLAAFAVTDITYEFSRIVSYYEVGVTIDYSRTAEELDSLQFVSGSSAIRGKIGEAVADFSPELLLWVSAFDGDTDSIRAMVARAYYDTPSAAFGLPEIDISIYPESGNQRIVALELLWPESRAELLRRTARLTKSADDFFALQLSNAEEYTPTGLYAALRDAIPSVDPEGASDPLSALSGERANQLAHTLALELLCQRVGFDTALVTGVVEEYNTCWLIVSTTEGYRHLLLSGSGEDIRLYTDLELSALGYIWASELYPTCVDYSGDLSAAASAPAPEGE